MNPGLPPWGAALSAARQRLASRAAGLAVLFGAILLSACGGGGSASPDAPAGPAASSDFGGTIVGKVARSGVAGSWGYTAADGRNYALMGTAKGVLVLDLLDPAHPRVVDEIDGPNDTRHAGIYWREMRVYGTHAYIVSEHTNVRGGIMVLDLAGLPNSVRYVKSVVPHDGELAAHTVDIDTARGLLYLQRETNLPAPPPGRATIQAAAVKPGHPVGKFDQGSVEIWDVKSDPENPRYLTTFNQHKSVHDMTAVGDFCYVAEGTASSYSVWDVKDPLAPRLLVRWQVEGGRYAHNVWPSSDGTFVVTTEELPTGLPARVWQLNGTAAPTQLASFKVGSGTPHNVVMEGRMAYLSHYSEGAAVVDLHNPAAPKIVAQVDTNPAVGPDLSGCWGVYKFPGQDLMICSDINGGFNLIRITAP